MRYLDRPRVQMKPVGESMTKQEFATDQDINFIVKKFQKTGVMGGLSHKVPEFADVSNAVTLHEAMSVWDEANAGFASLPSGVRDAAGNDPIQMLEMLDDPDGYAVLVEAGMEMEERPEPPPKTPPVVPATEPTPPVVTPAAPE